MQSISEQKYYSNDAFHPRSYFDKNNKHHNVIITFMVTIKMAMTKSFVYRYINPGLLIFKFYSEI